jgi:hypothetical protein
MARALVSNDDDTPHIHTYIHTCIYTHLYIHIRAHMQALTWLELSLAMMMACYTYIYTCIHIHTYMCIHTFIHTHTCMYAGLDMARALVSNDDDRFAHILRANIVDKSISTNVHMYMYAPIL